MHPNVVKVGCASPTFIQYKNVATSIQPMDSTDLHI